MIVSSDEIRNFLKELHHVLSMEHKQFLLDTLEVVKVIEKDEKLISIHGEHYSSCKWSKDTFDHGADTCICFSYEKKCEEAKKCMNLYNRFKMKLYNRFKF